MRQVAWHPRYREGIIKLLWDVPYKPAIWHWQFEENPFGKAFQPVVFIDDDDRVIGFNGVMPVDATDQGRSIEVLWSCDFYVAADWRGNKLGSKIKAELHRKATQIMALGVSDKACKVLAHLGWQRYHPIHSYRLTRQRDSLRNWAFTALQCFNRLRGGGARNALKNYTVEIQSRLPESGLVDGLWASSASGYGKVVTRNFAYLDWKYQRHPLARYAFVCAWQGGLLAGLLVVRYHAGHLRIVDYCGPARDPELKRALIRRCRKHWRHADQLSAVASDQELGNCLLAEGFFRPRSRPRFFIYTAQQSGVEGHSGWFIMSGDSDGELLSAAADACGGRRPFSNFSANMGETSWLSLHQESA